jgi:hypothetical protein
MTATGYGSDVIAGSEAGGRQMSFGRQLCGCSAPTCAKEIWPRFRQRSLNEGHCDR